MNLLSMISLYSGCGGLDLGFHAAGFSTAVCIDNERTACNSLERNDVSDAVICRDIKQVSNTEISAVSKMKPGKVGLLIGGPPCPAFSKSRFYRKEMAHGIDDPSFDTVKEYFRVVAHFLPKLFVMENVHTFAAARQKGALDYVLNEARRLGYSTQYRVLNAVNFGVPQKRERIFIVGCLEGFEFYFPEQTHVDGRKRNLFQDSLLAWRTAGDAIQDLDTDDHDSDLPGHFAGGSEHDLLKEVPPGDNYLYFTEKRGYPDPKFEWRARYWSFLLKLSPEKPSWTIQARRSNNMGPFHWRSRILTVAEIKRLQTFPDQYYLDGGVEKQWRQIGNAVPPLLANAIATQVRQSLAGA